jgi:hypothetical protein
MTATAEPGLPFKTKSTQGSRLWSGIPPISTIRSPGRKSPRSAGLPRGYADQVKGLVLGREGPKRHADDALRKDLDVMNPDATINRGGDGKQRRQQQSRTR